MFNKIKDFCDDQHISITQLGLNLGINPCRLYQLKDKPGRCLDAEAVAKIADFMGISALELVSAVQKPKKDVKPNG